MAKRKWLSCYIPHRLELLVSPAWQAAPRPLLRMLERLEIEHLRHGGFKNGALFVSFTQFVDYGISRRSIRPIQELGASLGLMQVMPQDEGIRRDIRAPNAYRLTYVPAAGKEVPTDEWKSVPAASVKRLLERFRAEEKIAEKAVRKEAA